MSHVIGLLLTIHPANALNKNNNFEVVALILIYVNTYINQNTFSTSFASTRFILKCVYGSSEYNELP